MSKEIFSRPSIHALIIALLGLIVYSNTFHVPFLFDDEPSITNNPVIRSLEGFLAGAGYDYNPRRFIGYLTIALNYRLGGLDVTGYHVFNLAVHIVSALLAYCFVQLTLKTPFFWDAECDTRGTELITQNAKRKTQNFVPLLAALLFVCHPVQTQAVTYIVQRLASLATMFYLASLVCYAKARLTVILAEGPDPKPKTSLLFLALSLFSAVLAMKSKELAVTLPAVVLMYEFFFFRGKMGRRLFFLLPMLLTVAVVPLSMVEGGKPAGELLSDLSEKTRADTLMPRTDYLFTQFRVIVTYIRLLFLPINQNLDYDYPVYHSLFAPPVFLSFLFLLSLFGLAVYLFYRSTFNVRCSTFEIQNYNPSPLTPLSSRLISFGILWFFVTLSVESSVVPIADVIFEHRLYLPSVGFFIALATFLIRVGEKLRSVNPAVGKAFILVIATMVLALTGAAYARNSVWRDGIRLWEDVVSKSPAKARSRNTLGVFYREKGRYEDAIREFRTALRYAPENVLSLNNLGNIYQEQGYIKDAIELFKAAIRYQADYADPHYNLGNAYLEQGLSNKAIQEYKAAIKLKMDHADLRYSLGNAYEKSGLLREAEREYLLALNLMPDHAYAHNSLGLLYAKNGRYEEAKRAFQAAIRLLPGNPDGYNNLGVVCLKQGNYMEAIVEFRNAVKLQPNHAAAIRNLENINNMSKGGK